MHGKSVKTTKAQRKGIQANDITSEANSVGTHS